MQFPIGRSRVVFAASGTNPAATVIHDAAAIIDYGLYWTTPRTEDEALYLLAVLNSETTRARAEKWQSTGQWGARHFDKVVFNLPIPDFDAASMLHRDIASAGAHAETVAAGVEFPENEHFTRVRRRIRDTLRADGVADEIDRLVARLLD